MLPIGGYFSLELPKHEEYHANAIKLNTGRNCLEYILRCKKYSKVYIPYYNCAVTLEPFQKLGVTYSFYHINYDLEIAEEITLHKNEAILYINYFGLKERYTRQLSEVYGNRLIVDNTQAFYSAPIPGIDTFYTCRKFFGVPDGAYLYTDIKADFEILQDYSYDRMSFLLKRIDISPEAGYADFREESNGLVMQPIKYMSNLTKTILQSIDYKSVALKRRANYIKLEKGLSDHNRFSFILEDTAVPLIYPFLSHSTSLRNSFINEKIFVAQYWPNVINWTSCESTEYNITQHLSPLPLDQRYTEKDMESIIETYNKITK